MFYEYVQKIEDNIRIKINLVDNQESIQSIKSDRKLLFTNIEDFNNQTIKLYKGKTLYIYFP